MNLYLIVSALAGLGSAVGHSYLSERFILGPMYAGRGDNRVLANHASWRVTRAMFHLVSLAWIALALTTLWFMTHPPDAEAMLAFAALGAAIYFASAVGNLWALRRPHLGNILLTIAAVTLVAGALG